MNDFLALLQELGPESIRLMNDPTTEAIQQKYVRTSGILAVDYASGIGGFPKHRIIEIFGPESSGKTTLCLMKSAVETRRKKYVVFIDQEHALDLKYARSLGVDMDYFSLSQPNSAEEAGGIMIKAARTKGCSMVILDSIAQLETEQAVESDLNAANIATTARFMKNLCLKLPSICSVYQTLVIFTNQNREKPGVMFGNPVYQPGGRAYKHACSMRIELARKTTNKEHDKAISNTTRAKFVKNKLGMPYTECEFDIIFAIGADNAGTAIKLGQDTKVLTKKGSTYSWNGNALGVGLAKAKAAIEGDKKLYESIRKEILAASLGKEVQSTKNEEVSRTQEPSKETASDSNVRRVLWDS